MARFNRDERKSLITERMPFFPLSDSTNRRNNSLRFLEPFIYLKCANFWNKHAVVIESERPLICKEEGEREQEQLRPLRRTGELTKLGTNPQDSAPHLYAVSAVLFHSIVVGVMHLVRLTEAGGSQFSHQPADATL